MSDRGRDQTGTREKTSGKDDPGKISALQIAAATGAATTAAVVANALGIYGTVVGVAVISVISSVGSVVYLKSMRHTKEKFDKVVRNRDTIVLRSKTGGVAATVVAAAPSKDAAAPTEPVTRATGTAKVPAVVIPDDEPPSASQRGKLFLKRNWRSIAVSSLVVFVLTVGLLTSLAMLSGKPATSFYDSSPRQSGSSEENPPPRDEEQSSHDEQSSDEPSPSEDESTAPGTEEPSSPETTEEPEPSTQDSNPEDDGDGDGDLKPTPSDRRDAASRR